MLQMCYQDEGGGFFFFFVLFLFRREMKAGTLENNFHVWI